MITQRKEKLLKNEVMMIQSWLDRFDPPYQNGRRKVHFHPSTGDYLIVENFPLPDGFSPDHLDLLIITEHYPDQPPIGFYMLNNQSNKVITSQISRKLNLFMNGTHHNAPEIPGYTWACLIYDGNEWCFNASAPHKKDNLAKFVQTAYALVGRL